MRITPRSSNPVTQAFYRFIDIPFMDAGDKIVSFLWNQFSLSRINIQRVVLAVQFVLCTGITAIHVVKDAYSEEGITTLTHVGTLISLAVFALIASLLHRDIVMFERVFSSKRSQNLAVLHARRERGASRFTYWLIIVVWSFLLLPGGIVSEFGGIDWLNVIVAVTQTAQMGVWIVFFSLACVFVPEGKPKKKTFSLKVPSFSFGRKLAEVKIK